MNAIVFFGGKNMGADGQIIVVAVDELEGQHSALSIQRSAHREPKTSYHTRLRQVWNVVRCSSFAAQKPQFALRLRLPIRDNC
jgi:hypothetical protein